MTRTQQIERAARDLLKRYVDLVNCGDCGNWDPETEPEIIEMRSALALPAEGGEPKLETTAERRALLLKHEPEYEAWEGTYNKAQWKDVEALCRDIDTLLARTDRDGVIEECISALANLTGPDPEDGEYESGHLDGRLKALEALCALRPAPAQDERGKIVAWMRGEKIDGIWIAEELADAIERGEHLKEKP